MKRKVTLSERVRYFHSIVFGMLYQAEFWLEKGQVIDVEDRIPMLYGGRKKRVFPFQHNGATCYILEEDAQFEGEDPLIIQLLKRVYGKPVV